MRIFIAAVGRARRGPEGALYEHYAQRIAFPLTLREVEEKRPLPAARLKAREGELLMAALPAGALKVALDRGGRNLGSRELARLLGTWRDEGIRDVAFIIGGAEGLDKALVEGADLVLALGAMTWPHLLARAMLAEQIYRAQCILEGHPYHRQ